MPDFDPFAGYTPSGGLTSNLSAGAHSAAAGLGFLGAAAGLPTLGWAANQSRIAGNAENVAAQNGVPQTLGEVSGPTDLLKYSMGKVAESAPILGEVAAGALLGGIPDAAVAAAGPLARTLGRRAIESAVEKGVARDVAETAAAKGVASAAGGAAATYPSMVGQNLETQYDQSGRFNVPAALAAGVPEAAMNVMAPEGRMARGALAPIAETGSHMLNAASGFGIGAVAQGGIGAMQAFLTETQKASVDPSYDLLGAESQKNIAESAGTGALLGGIIQGVHGALHAESPGVSSRDQTTQASTTASNNTPNEVNYDRPAYERAGVTIPGVNDTGDAIGAAMGGQQGELPLQGGRNPGPFAPNYDASGNPIARGGAPADATAAAVGPGPNRTVADAVDGLQRMHQDLTGQLQQALAAGQDGTTSFKRLSDQIKEVEQHLQTLDAQPLAGQRSLDLSGPLERSGTGLNSGTVLFGDKDATQQLDTAKQIVTEPNPATPNPNAQIEVPQQPPKPMLPSRPGEIPNGMALANRRVPPEPEQRIVTPDQKPGFQLQGHETPQFALPPLKEAPQLSLESPDNSQRELPLEHVPAHPAPDTRTGDMFAGGQAKGTPWQTRMRLAWKDSSEGSLQGFHKAMKDALGAASPEEAAKAIREKAADDRTATAYSKLDAVHRALTGESIEQGGIREASEAARAERESVQQGPGDGTVDRAAEGGEVGQQPEAAPHAAQTDNAGRAAQAAAEGAGTGAGGTEAAEGAASDYQRRAEAVSRHVAELEATKDPDVFQQHVNALYRLWQERANGGDRAAHLADVYLHDPENGVTDENLRKAANTYDEEEINRLIQHSATQASKLRSEGTSNPDTGRRTLLPEAMRQAGSAHTGGELVRYLADNAKNPAVRTVMQALRGKSLDHVPVKIVHEGDSIPAHAEHEFRTGADAVTLDYGNRTEVYALAHAADEETMAHELLHAAFPEKLTPANDGGMTAIMNDVRQRMQAAGMLDTPEGKFFAHEALNNVNEFASYGFTSPTFRAMIEKLDQPGKPTLWERFKAAVRAVMQLPKAFLQGFDRIMDRTSGESSPTFARMSAALDQMLQRETPADEAARVQKYRQMAVSPAGATEALKEGATDLWGHLKALGNKVVFASVPTHAIAESFDHQLPALRDVVRAIDDRTAAQHTMAKRAAQVHDLLQKAYKAADKSLDRFNTVIEDTQIAGLDPRVKGSLERAQLNMVRAKDEFDRLSRAKDATPLQKASAKETLRRATAAARLADSWGKMSAAEKAAVGDSFDALRESMERRQKAANDILLKSADGFHDPVLDELRAQGADQQQINDHILSTYGRVFRTAQEPYAPLRRYGDWVTVASSKDYRAAEAELREARTEYARQLSSTGKPDADAQERVRTAEQHLALLTKDPDHRIVEFHDSSVGSQKRVDALKTAHPDMEVQRFARADYMQHAGALSGGMISKIIDAVGQQLPEELRDNIGAVIREMYVDSLPDNSFDQSMQGRGGVAGYSTDFSRAILDTLLRDSFNVSTLENADPIAAAMKDLDTQRRGAGTDTANNIYKSIAKRIAFSTDHQNFRQWEQRISEVSHAFYLGFSPGFMLMNMMQMPLITMPMLYARFGLHANGVVTQAVADVWDSIKKGNLDHTKSTRMNDAEKEVLTRLQNLGILNMTQLHDMAVAARQSNIIDPQTRGEAVAKGWEVSKDMANLPAQYVETVNRAASALAAYRLAREGKSRFGAMEHGAAMDYAAKIVRDSHVDYAAVNHAAWLRQPGGRLLFQFKKYWLNMISMVSLNMWDAFGHGSEVRQLRNALADSSLSDEAKAEKQHMLDALLERRAVARRTLAGLYGAHYLITGAMGMPFAGLAASLANVMRNWYGDPEDKADTATDLQNWLSGVFGVEPADVMMHGIFGGIFGANAQRISMGDLANPLTITTNRAGSTAQDMFDKVLIGALGPTVGLGEQLLKGSDLIAKGNYVKGMEQILPRAAADVLRGVEYSGGQATTAAGKVVTPTSNLDAIKEALGVQPEVVANAYQARAASADAKQQFVGTRNGLIKELATAQQGGGDTAAIQKQVDAFNERNPQEGLRITAGDVLRARAALTRQPKEPTGSAKAIAERTDKSAFTKE